MVPKDAHAPRIRFSEFRFYEELNDYLPESRRRVSFRHEFRGTPSVGDIIQAIGVPHTEVDLILVDGVSVDFMQPLCGGERVAVYPMFERLDISPVVRLRPEPLRSPRFILDSHLGKLARYLRMLGFDASWQPGWNDRTLIDLSLEQARTILTRDVGLLKHRRVTHGYWLRHQQPDRQLIEVLLKLDLAGRQDPFTRCLDCNGVLKPAARETVKDAVEPEILARFDSFRRCPDCGKVYWRGSHYRRMLDFIRLAESMARVEQLLAPAAYPHDVCEIQLVETHISWVILTGPFAYKIKKPVRLGFLDFSTLELRRHFCREELRVNRRMAPDLYLGVVPIGAAPEGLRLGHEPALEYAVKMCQFPHDDRLDRCLRSGRFGEGEAVDLAAMIARFHHRLPPRPGAGATAEPERAARPARKNFIHLDPFEFPDRSQQQLAVIEDWTWRQAEMLKATFKVRALAGKVRECHGDLHLENLILSEGRFIAFDAVEFNPELRWIDIANDIAFLAMDLMARGREDLAMRVLNAWLEHNGDYHSLKVMRFYLVYRSMVRAVVTAMRQQQSPDAGTSFRQAAERYVELAADLVDTPPPRLYLMHGFSGSGKTWTSDRLVGELPALRVRSDLERKRLPERPANGKTGGTLATGLYGPEAIDRTYEMLGRHCESGLRAGFSMIADATFLQRRHRRYFIELAKREGVQLHILHCGADDKTLRNRIRRRGAAASDASEAGLAVLDHQLSHHDPLDRNEQALVLDQEIDLSLSFS
jgi:aminoglycoside phosphotransferase family enzyme/predicted kinase